MRDERRRIAVASDTYARAEELARGLAREVASGSEDGVQCPLADCCQAEPCERFDEVQKALACDRVALLVGRQALDERETTYLKLAAEYGGDRRARRRARAEVRRLYKKRGTAS